MARKTEVKRMLRMWDIERVMWLNESRVELEKARADLLERYPKERAMQYFHELLDDHQRHYQRYLETYPFRPTAAVVVME